MPGFNKQTIASELAAAASGATSPLPGAGFNDDDTLSYVCGLIGVGEHGFSGEPEVSKEDLASMLESMLDATSVTSQSAAAAAERIFAAIESAKAGGEVAAAAEDRDPLELTVLEAPVLLGKKHGGSTSSSAPTTTSASSPDPASDPGSSKASGSGGDRGRGRGSGSGRGRGRGSGSARGRGGRGSGRGGSSAVTSTSVGVRDGEDGGEEKTKGAGPVVEAHGASSTGSGHLTMAGKASEIVDRGLSELDEIDDWSSAWEDVKKSGGKWGGRGHGGRAMGRMTQLHTGKDIVLEGVTLAFGGKDLLSRSQLRFHQGRRYGLIGRNGVGKSTLLRRMARCAIPGFPRHLRVAYMNQEIAGVADMNAIQYLMSCEAIVAASGLPVTVSDVTGGDMSGEEAALVAEQEELEALLGDEGAGDDVDMDAVSERLCEIYEMLERLRGGGAEDREDGKGGAGGAGGASAGAGGGAGDSSGSGEDDDGDDDIAGDADCDVVEGEDGAVARLRHTVVDMLKKLGFTRELRSRPTSLLSGGWRTRVALAEALLTRPDVLLLDEPTNHLDLHGVLWLQTFLQGGGLKECGCSILIVVSHDKAFLDGVITDVVLFENCQLTTFPGSLSLYEEMMAEKATHTAHMLDARARQEKKAKAFIASAKSANTTSTGKKKKYVDPKKQQAAKTKAKKVERIGYFRSDGKAFKTHSLAKMDEAAMLLPEKVEAARQERALHFKFPSPEDVSSSLRSISGLNDPVMRLENAAVGYDASKPAVLNHVTLQITLNSRIAIVGPNGAGKTTLLKLLLGKLMPVGSPEAAWTHHNLRVAYVAQHHIDELEDHLEQTPVAYLGEKYGVSSELQIRSHLGAFGLAGGLALAKIGTLSGGQKARLVFAAVTWTQPHLLVLDEPTNHIDLAALNALSDGLRAFGGGVVLVSHDAHFISSFCTELWIVDKGEVKVRKPSGGAAAPEEAQAEFPAMFEEYKRSVVRKMKRQMAALSSSSGGSGGSGAYKRG